MFCHRKIFAKMKVLQCYNVPPPRGPLLHPLEYLFNGVRPSSAAATSARSSGSDCPNTTGSPCVSAPEDGRTPLSAYSMEESETPWFRSHRTAKPVRHAFLLSALFLLLNWTTCGLAADTFQIRSPDRSVEFRLFERESRLTYAITFKRKPVIEASPLSVMLDGVDLNDNVEFGEVKRSVQRETYPWRGIHSQATNHCNGATVAASPPPPG